ncbi:MAG: GntR family transcriptional regulator [Desulfotalea sp.]
MVINKDTYADVVVSYIKKCILDGTYKPGTKVKELVIAKKLSISRAPIREALQILIKEGLLIWHPQKGKYITKLNPKQIRDSYFSGGILESAAVSTNLHLYTAKDIQRLEKIVAAMKSVDENNKPIETIAALDNKFHEVLFSRVDNEFVIEFCRRSCQGLSKFLLFRYWIKMYSAHEVYLRHKEIVDALKHGDPIALENTIRQHYFNAGERMSIVSQEVDDQAGE